MDRPGTRHRFVTLDVFTDRPFGGNPLAVFPDAADIPEAALQPIAREFNLSETVFILPGGDGADADLRIFTPVHEMPFAGHPTVGAALVLAAAGRIAGEATLGLKAGPVAVRVDDGTAVIAAPQPPRVLGGAAPDAAAVAACVGLPKGDVAGGERSPLICSAGAGFLFACVSDRAALSRAIPGQTSGDFVGTALIALDHIDDGVLHMRMFAPLSGIPEDPATGSAAAALPAYLRHLGIDRPDFTVHQGDDMGRPSRIAVSTFTGSGAESVRIGGGAVVMSEGEFLL